MFIKRSYYFVVFWFSGCRARHSAWWMKKGIFGFLPLAVFCVLKSPLALSHKCYLHLHCFCSLLSWRGSHKQACAVAAYFPSHQVSTAALVRVSCNLEAWKLRVGSQTRSTIYWKFFSPREKESGVLLSCQGIVLKSQTETLTIQDRSKC